VFNIFVTPLLYLVSFLPFWLLHIKSRGLYFWVYYVFGYRKKVVLENLRNSFPEKSEQEIRQIAKDFYKHFCDVIFEIIKLLTISKKQFLKRFEFTPQAVAVFNEFHSQNKSIVGVLGHCGNWEWAFPGHIYYFETLITAVYHPLSNKSFDALMLKLRGRHGGKLVAMRDLYRELLKLKQDNIPTTLGLISDQTPPPESAYWTTFLNQDTPVFNGPEKLAKKFNYPVIYVSVMKTKRSCYSMDAVVITREPNKHPEGEISELHTKALERNIIAQPHTWLWSHRRWKHKRQK
jgi:KDO2-lipid IV(A) lauroyltransferase